MLRILTVSTLYPNAQRPAHGIFVENRLRHLVAGGQVESRVVAPVAWFPFRHSRFGRFSGLGRIPTVESRHGISVHHPRYPVIPKIGMSIAPTLLYLALRSFVPALLEKHGDIDLIDAHYFYPDGVAAVMLAKQLGKPVVITARGTDINLIPQYALPRRQIQWAARNANGMIAVCQALKTAMVELRIDDRRIRVLPNGVDLEQFQPRPRDEARRKFSISGPTLLSVGHLIERKGHDLTIRSLNQLPGVSLVIAGEGPERSALESLVRQIGVADRVRFLGLVSQADLPDLYSAADALVLASSREGWANVLLEAMACGTPAIATDVWGNAEVVAEPAAGLLVQRTPDGIAEGAKRLFSKPPSRHETRLYAERFSWDATTAGQVEVFQAAMEPRAPFIPDDALWRMAPSLQ
jgi:glycosyltransferase involved in cell wall biosynthesis